MQAKVKKRIVAILCVIMLLVGMVPAELLEAEIAEEPFVALEEASEETQEDSISAVPEGIVNGYIDVELEEPLSIAEYENYYPQNYATYESSYDPREDASWTVPEIRNQNPLGTCWSFSAIAAVEFSLVTKGQRSGDDMSEFQLGYFATHGWEDELGLLTGDAVSKISNGQINPDWYSGGNSVFTKFSLMNWAGAVSEKEYPETAYDVLKSSTTAASLDNSYAMSKDVAHVQNVYVINTDDKDLVKEMIKKYGAVGCSYYSSDTYYKNNTFYNPVDTGSNHAIAIVGWDDNFSKSEFAQTPAADGAWLIRNSWGGNWGDEGYFWISYEDVSLQAEGYIFDAYARSDTNNYYDYNYQYDGGIYPGYGNVKNGSTLCNVFTAQGKEILKAVSVYMYENTEYEVNIYKNPSDVTNPESGILVGGATVTGTNLYQGYHTIKLNSNVALEAGDVFAVAVTLNELNSGSWMRVGIDKDYNGGWIKSDITYSENQSFIKDSGSWRDYGKSIQGNLRIKAYTVNGVQKPITGISLKENEITLETGETYVLKAGSNLTITPSGTDDTLTFSSSNEMVACVEEDGTVTALRPGTTTINIASRCGSGSAALKVTVPLKKEAESVKLSPESLTVAIGATQAINAVITPADSDDYATYTSSDVSIATVTPDGKVKGVKEGTTTITGTTLSGLKATCEVTVLKRGGATIECEFKKLPGKVYKYQTYAVKTDARFAKFQPTQVTWTSSSSNVSVTGNTDGSVTLFVVNADSTKKRGEKVTITAELKKTVEKKGTAKEVTKKLKKKISLFNKSYSIDLSQTGITSVTKGEKIQLTTSFNGGEVTDQPTNSKVKWMITDSEGKADGKGKAVAGVNGKGLVIAKGPGTTYVTACAADSYDKATKTYLVKKIIPVNCVSVATLNASPSEITLKQGEQKELRELLVFNKGKTVFNQDKMKITWSSSDKRAVAVNGKGIVAVKKKAPAGTYTITAKAVGGVRKGETIPETTFKITVPETTTVSSVSAYKEKKVILFPSNEILKGQYKNSKIKTFEVERIYRKIGAKAFKNCKKLKKIVIPETVTKIGKNAFAGCKKLVIYAPEGSVAIEYAKKHGISYVETAARENYAEQIVSAECYYYVAGTYPCYAKRKSITDEAMAKELYQKLEASHSDVAPFPELTLVGARTAVFEFTLSDGTKRNVMCDASVYRDGEYTFGMKGSIQEIWDGIAVSEFEETL